MKNWLIAALCLTCAYFVFMLKLKDVRLQDLSAQNAALADDIKRQIIIQNRKVVHKYRDKEAVITREYYLPPEGRLEVREQQNGAPVKILLSDKGFTLRPFAAALAGPGGAQAALGARLLYWRRWGAGAAFAQKAGPGLFIDRRLDDVLPFAQNISLILYAAPKEQSAGLAVYF